MSKESLKQSFRYLFEPKSVAFIGASNTPGKWGFSILLNILEGGYKGRIYPINLKREKVLGLTCYKRIEEIEEVPDLAVIVVPAALLLDVMRSCVEKGIRAAVVITSGFAETGTEGRLHQDKLLAMAREGGLRFIGPNSMGIFTAFPDRLNSIMASVVPEPGPVAIVAQSGNLGVSLMTRLLRRGIGISRCISIGNQADLTTADYINALGDDEKTSIISAYIEGAHDGRRLLDAIERTSKKKPIVILKSARSEAGRRAAMSHTAALTGSYDVFKAAVKEAGALLTDSMDELINIVGGFHSHPLPKGNRVGVLTLGGGWGVLGTDACEHYGLKLPELPSDVFEKLNNELPYFWSKGNPIDLVASMNPDSMPEILEHLMRSDAFDSVIYLGAGYLSYRGLSYRKSVSNGLYDLKEIGDRFIATERAISDKLLEMRKKYNKPILPVTDLIVRDDESPSNIVRQLEHSGLFIHNAPWQAAHALEAMNERRLFLKRKKMVPSEPLQLDSTDEKKIRELIKTAGSRPAPQMSEHESKQVLSAIGAPITREFEVDSIEEAVRAAEEIGYPVVLKLSTPEILHKSETGGVIPGVTDSDKVRSIAGNLLKRGKLLVQEMLSDPPVELLIGLKQDSMFGPVLVFGKGGIETEVWRDSATLTAPVNSDQADRLIASTKVDRLIGPFRGRKALDRNLLIRLLVRISQLPSLFPEILELDINPLFLYENGATVVDAAIILSASKD